MADQTFRISDYAGDEVILEKVGELLSVRLITHGESQSVDLSREEGIKLARAILAALDAEPEQGLTHRALDGMPEGAEVYDNVMEKWTKSGYGWKFYAGTLFRSSVDLIEQYGPITAKDGVGSVRHADKTETGDTP